MTDLTPETLDQLADQLGTAGQGSWALSVEAHADQWEKDLAVLRQAEARIEALEKALAGYPLVPSITGPKECYDFAGRLTDFGKGYSSGYQGRLFENHAALAAVRETGKPEGSGNGE